METIKTNPMLKVMLLFFILVALFSDCILATEAISSDPNQSTKYLDAVRVFADNVLKYGRDTYGPKHTPLFVDGLNIHTLEPVKWIDPDGTKWILSNLASQQNLFRTLDGLTAITGDPKYKQAAMDAIKYAFENLRSPNGLLYWGGHSAYDVLGDVPYSGGRHELKAFYPYYELMWEVNPMATKQFIESFWSGHILDWSTLDMDRHAEMNKRFEKAWDYEYKDGAVFFQSIGRGRGSSFINAGSDLFYAAAWLTKLSGEKEPLVWGKRLASRYVETRNPSIGISCSVFSRRADWAMTQDRYGDDITRRLSVPGTQVFPDVALVNPIVRELALGYITPTPGESINASLAPWACQLMLGDVLDGEGDEFVDYALEELTAWGKVSYRNKDNVYVPILTDGTNLEGYVCKEDSRLLGPKGTALQPLLAGPSDFLTYSLAYKITGDLFMWEMACSIAKGNKFGDIGATPKDSPQLKISTDCSSPYALLAFLELRRETGKDDFLKIAKEIGDNILETKFHKGFFVASSKHIYTKFDSIDALVLLHLYPVLTGETVSAPRVWLCYPFFERPYRLKESGIDNEVVYKLTESLVPPKSLQEGVVEGDIEAVRSLIARGADVNGREDTLLKTALHHAVVNRQEEMVKLFLAKGARVDARDSGHNIPLHYAAEEGHVGIAELLIVSRDYLNAKNVAGDTPLHSAVKAGHRDIVELLIAKGADVNVKNAAGQTPVDIAVSRNRSEVVELLIEKGADVSSIHLAAYLGDAARVMNFIEGGIDVNAKDQEGKTPLHYAAMAGSKEVSELLLTRGAGIKAKDKNGATPLHWGSAKGHRDLAEFLITKGADIDARDDSWSETPLHYAAYRGHKEVVELLIAKGANIHVKDKDGYTPLHWAVHAGHRDVAELLIAKGADVNAKNNKGKTAMSLAKEKGHTEIVELLRKHGTKE